MPLGGGSLDVDFLKENAVRIRQVPVVQSPLQELLYVKKYDVDNVRTEKPSRGVTRISAPGLTVILDSIDNSIAILGESGDTLLRTEEMVLARRSDPSVRLKWRNKESEHLYGLGQFQDGYLDVSNLSRRLTQVNTQIAIPFLQSDRGYGILWNNYGLTEFNPSDTGIDLVRTDGKGEVEEVNATSTEGNRKELRESNVFTGRLVVPESGRYALLLDVGQKMARRHDLVIDGRKVIDMRNVWLPPTASTIVDLEAGEHEIEASLEKDDRPHLYYRKVDDTSTFMSPVADGLDFTIFAGTPDEVTSAYHDVTGNVPMLPRWLAGYVHCRERFHSQKELLDVASTFRKKSIPVDVIVQDWQYWGEHGWNAMTFDRKNYEDPAGMVKSLHDLDMRLMISVWAKLGSDTEVGKEAREKGYIIPETEWVDFFNPEAAGFYWSKFSSRMLRPYGIDAWWQDATEPENDDLDGRMVNDGRLSGNRVRNVFPLMVNNTVYNGLRSDDPERRTAIMTRSGAPGIQRYGVILWSGDVGNDWETLRRQITGGLGLMASGHPWWTYDAGGFFRPGNQYDDKDYIERLIRWVQVSAFLPVMRIHGYMSDTEPWNYGPEAERIIGNSIALRYSLLPYIYSGMAQVSGSGQMLMRPLLFDFPKDDRALDRKYEYMFGKSLLVCPVTESLPASVETYLPSCRGGWYDFYTGTRYNGGQTLRIDADLERIPVFAKGGSIVPVCTGLQSTEDMDDAVVTINVYPGDDAVFDLYEDQGKDYGYAGGEYSVIGLSWNDSDNTFVIGERKGSYPGMRSSRDFIVRTPAGEKRVRYDGSEIKVAFD